MQGIPIQQVFDELEEPLRLRLITGRDGLSRVVRVPRIQKPGLALTGYDEQLHKERVLTLGGTEIEYLRGADPKIRQLGIDTVMGASPVCIVITRDLEPPDELIRACERHSVPLMVTPLVSSEFIVRVNKSLQEHLSPQASLHGVLVEVLGVGILLRGKSGIGKSEAALDLVVRGHRLVADDVVQVRRLAPNVVSGSGTGIIKHHMEIRGLGIINIKHLFGVSSVLEQKRISLVVELCEWDDQEDYDRLGVDDNVVAILGEELPILRIPVRPGRNIATVIEVAARNQLLKSTGYNAARVFQENLNRAISEGAPVEESAESEG